MAKNNDENDETLLNTTKFKIKNAIQGYKNFKILIVWEKASKIHYAEKGGREVKSKGIKEEKTRGKGICLISWLT